MDNFVAGIITGCCLMISAIFLMFTFWTNSPTEIISNVRMVPEWKLVTDGKTVDTVFIYRQK